MTDRIAPVGQSAASLHAVRPSPVDRPAVPADVAIARVHAGLAEAKALAAEAQRAASRPAGALAADVEGLLIATRQADAAFRMLQAVRNAMVEAYERTQLG